MGLIYTDSSYDMAGRKRKKRKTRGEVYKKYTKPAFKPLTATTSYARSRLDEGKQYKSVDSNVHSTARPERPEYSGDYVIGLATMHKSNIVPVGRGDDAESYAKMRRN